MHMKCHINVGLKLKIQYNVGKAVLIITLLLKHEE